VLIVSRRLLDLGPEGMRLPGPLPPHTRTIVVGLEDDPAFAADARRAGAAAYVLKDRADRELRPAIDALLEEAPVTTAWPLSA
jgi:DNA-binding NarL/FixJ family response regulator